MVVGSVVSKDVMSVDVLADELVVKLVVVKDAVRVGMMVVALVDS